MHGPGYVYSAKYLWTGVHISAIPKAPFSTKLRFMRNAHYIQYSIFTDGGGVSVSGDGPGVELGGYRLKKEFFEDRCKGKKERKSTGGCKVLESKRRSCWIVGVGWTGWSTD